MIACNHYLGCNDEVRDMASLTVRNISDNTKAKLKIQAKAGGRSLEAYVRYILERTADSASTPGQEIFPQNLLALVEPGEDIEHFIETQDQKQPVVEL
jgi:plasmid stability protein